MTEILIKKTICIITAVDSYSLCTERCHSVIKWKKKILKAIYTKIQFWGEKVCVYLCIFGKMWKNIHVKPLRSFTPGGTNSKCRKQEGIVSIEDFKVWLYITELLDF